MIFSVILSQHKFKKMTGDFLSFGSTLTPVSGALSLFTLLPKSAIHNLHTFELGVPSVSEIGRRH